MHELQVHNLKEIAARYAINHFVKAGMNVGLGSGSTAAYAVTALAERIRTEHLTLGALIATSAETADLARFHGIHAARDLSKEVGWLDVTVDGADEVDHGLNVIKGGGGALLREKLVAARTRREVIVVDQSKVSSRLGEKHSLPIMVFPYAWETTADRIAAICGAKLKRRVTQTNDVFISDDGLYCLDVETGPIADPADLEARLKAVTGVADVGLFIGMAQTIVVAKADGKVELMERPPRKIQGTL